MLNWLAFDSLLLNGAGADYSHGRLCPHELDNTLLDMSPHQSETVILVHGLAGSRLDMILLSRRFKRIGYAVENWGYWSLNTSIQTHAKGLAQVVQAVAASNSVNRIHLVGHSMGAIVIRAMLANHFRDEWASKLSRAILLAPPNRGSYIATHFAPWLGWLTPSLAELSDHPDSFVNRLPNSLQLRKLEFGVIEASKDRVIRPDCVQLEGQADFARIEGQHGLLTWYRQTLELVEQFLRSGKFQNEQESENRVAATADENSTTTLTA